MKLIVFHSGDMTLLPTICAERGKIENLRRPPIATFTVTITLIVQYDIIISLNFYKPEKFVSGFSRNNLELRVIQTNKDSEKFGDLSHLVEAQKAGIVDYATRKRIEKVASEPRPWNYFFAFLSHRHTKR